MPQTGAVVVVVCGVGIRIVMQTIVALFLVSTVVAILFTLCKCVYVYMCICVYVSSAATTCYLWNVTIVGAPSSRVCLLWEMV